MNVTMTGEELVDMLEGHGVAVQHNQSESDEYAICCPFCVDEGETPDERFRLGFNIQTGNAHCFNCDWSTSSLDFLISRLVDKLDAGEIETGGTAPKKEKPHKTLRLPSDFTLIESPYDDYWMRRAYKYLRRRHVTTRQISEKKMGFSLTDDDYAYRVVLPIYYRDKLRGIVSRDFTGKSSLKYKNSEGDKYLYNMPWPPMKSVVLSEGAFDSLAIERGLRYDKVKSASGAVLGHTLTTRQLKQLNPYNDVCIWFDPDAAGVKGTIKVAKQLLELKKRVTAVCPRRGKEDDYDPSDYTPEEISRRLRQAIPFTDSVEQRLQSWIAFME